MTDDLQEATPEESPDYLPSSPKRGHGVRRLNAVPLIIVGAILAIVVLAMSWTYYVRAGMHDPTNASDLDAGNVTAPAQAPIAPDDPQSGNVAEPIDEFANATTPTDAVVPAVQPAPQQVQAQPIVPAPAPVAGPPPAPTISPEREARIQAAISAREARATAYRAALSAEPAVSGFNRSGGAAAGGRDMPPGMAEAQASAMRLANLGQAFSASQGAGAGGAAFGMGQGEGQEGGDPNRQAHKRQFLESKPDADVYSRHTREYPTASTEVKAGTVIPGVMIGGINSDLPGQIVAQVRQNVYDSASGRYLLIPAGARLIGTYDTTITGGQKRVLVAWQRVIFPDGSSVVLDQLPGADRGGYAGFRDKTNSHYGRMFSNALLLSAFSAATQLSQPQSQGSTYSAREIASAELGRQLGQLGMEMARRGMDVQPTIRIRPGYRFNVMVTKDIILPRWLRR